MTVLQEGSASTGERRWVRSLPGRAVPVATAAATAVAATVLYRIDPHEPGHYPTCPFLATTGLYCPGCGSLRAVHDLLHGDVAGALARNPAVLLALPYLALALVTWLLRSTGRPVPRSTSLPAWVLWTLLGAVLAYGVLRNVPGGTWLSPA